jgi:DNA-binding PadR family transcriptional regulator
MGNTLGELEQLLLMALLRLGGEASGIDLRTELTDRIGRTVLPGAIYTIMERLRERGLVTSYTGASSPQRGGRRRKYYRLAPSGERALADAYRQVERMSEGIADRLRTHWEES